MTEQDEKVTIKAGAAPPSEITNGQICELHKALEKLCEQPFEGSVSRKIVAIRKLTTKISTDVGLAQMDLAKQYGDPHPDDANKVTISGEKKEMWFKALTEYNNTPVPGLLKQLGAHKISQQALSKAQITPNDLDSLRWVVSAS